jgi:hypothetical protein
MVEALRITVDDRKRRMEAEDFTPQSRFDFVAAGAAKYERSADLLFLVHGSCVCHSCDDEFLFGGSFVEKVQQHWWPQYSWRKFFWFNTGYFVIMIASVVAYDLRGGSWLILPLAWAIERLCNGFCHLWWTIHFREYSPGLVSSILIWMNSYFIVRYRPVGETIAPPTL